MSRKKEKAEQPILYEVADIVREIEHLKAEIRRVNQILRETHNPHEFKQNKRYLERLERKLRLCQNQVKKTN